MGCNRIRSFQQIADKVPPEAHVEVWGDSAVWLYTDSGKRLRLVEFIDCGFPPIEDWPNA